MTEDQAKTKWCPIPGFEAYEVSSDGVVRSITRMKPYRDGRRLARGRVLKPAYVKGYPRVTLWRDGKQSSHLVHVLVGLLFLPDRPSPTHQLNHKNGDRADARAANLEWVTASENLAHAYRILGRRPAGGKSFGAANGRYVDGRRCGLAGAPQ